MNCNGRQLILEKTIVMGILNATPDSFYNKGRQSSIYELCTQADSMLEEGASILDIGGMSTRPNATLISVDEELQRVLPVIGAIKSNHPHCFISIDTFRSEVAEQALQSGADIINDISGGEFDRKIINIAHTNHAPYICMHMQGTPQTMQQNPHYEDVCRDIYSYFKQKIKTFQCLGLDDVIVDIGLGFGKTLEHNYELLSNLNTFESLQKPLLVGLSRKSMVYKPLHLDAEHALNGTTALHMIALQQGANILRVHDVKEAVQCITLYEKLKAHQKPHSIV